jgi:hypothetical protein
VSLMNDIEWDPANFLAVLVGTQNRVMAIFKLRTFLQKPSGDFLRSVHSHDVVAQISATLVGNGLCIRKVEMVARHYFSRRASLYDIRSRGTFMDKNRHICFGVGWVCENHPDFAWDKELGCECGVGMPCECNNEHGRSGTPFPTLRQVRQRLKSSP